MGNPILQVIHPLSITQWCGNCGSLGSKTPVIQDTLPKTNSSHLKITQGPKRKGSSSNQPFFEVQTVSFRECISKLDVGKSNLWGISVGITRFGLPGLRPFNPTSSCCRRRLFFFSGNSKLALHCHWHFFGRIMFQHIVW